MTRIKRIFAAPLFSAAIFGATLGMAGTAGATMGVNNDANVQAVQDPRACQTMSLC